MTTITLKYLNQFPLIKYIPLGSSGFQISVLVVTLFEFLFLNRQRILDFFLGSRLTSSSKDHADQEIKIVQDHKKTAVSSGDVEIVLKRLGMFCESETKFPVEMNGDDMFNMFEEKSPSLDEVKEAFNVFDSNRDGFIDAKELHKVLCALGLKEGLEIENCMRMIDAFDVNGDGRIEFDEFVRIYGDY